VSSSARVMAKTKPLQCPVFDPSTLYQVLFDHYGPSGWWPGDSPFEVAIGAILTQNTAWGNVEKAITNLKAASMIDVRRIHEMDEERLASLIRPAGYYNMKAKRLKNFVGLVVNSFSGNFDALLNLDKSWLRSVLLEVNGIGKETADSICCYAAEKLIFVVDTYTRRILLRHGVIVGDTTYDDIQAFFESALPPNLSIYKDLHAHIVFIGKDYCRSRNPRCDVCPLRHRL
jgi:endonuclease III related protein